MNGLNMEIRPEGLLVNLYDNNGKMIVQFTRQQWVEFLMAASDATVQWIKLWSLEEATKTNLVKNNDEGWKL